MGVLETIGFILALAMLAGLNLYLTVFLTGLAVRFEWFHWASQIEALQAFGNPLVLGVALGLFLIEFGIDKVPWVDSLWDSIHTFLRPAGGIALAVAALGPEPSTLYTVLAVIFGGMATLAMHLFKAGLRLNINTSPEPFSNIAVSVLKDGLVVGGFLLAVNNPLAALFVFGGVLMIVVYTIPAIIRSSHAILWLIWKKVRLPADAIERKKVKLQNKLTAEEESALGSALGRLESPLIFAARCVTGKTKGVAGLNRNIFGKVVAAEKSPSMLYFVGKKGFRRFSVAIDLTGAEVASESRFLSECLEIASKKNKMDLVFRFHRGEAHLAEILATTVAKRLGTKVKLTQSEKTEKASESESGDEPAIVVEPAEIADEAVEPKEEEKKNDSDPKKD